MRTIIVALLVLMLPFSVMAKQPIGLKKWQHDDTTFSKQIGGAVRNYQKQEKTWAVIENDFEVENDSILFVEKSVLQAEVNKNSGVSEVTLNWNDTLYTVTQKMLGIGWIKISTRQSKWIDSTMNWSNFSVDSNICKWMGVSPGVDYRVRKNNGTVEHGIFFKPAFLDSAAVLYNQRADSLDIALANVMVYTLSANIDDADSAIGDVSWRRLKDFGYYTFNLSDQRLHFPGYDTLPQIPVRQYWERRGTKIICIEYVMMRRVKQVHEAYPSATIWHNDTKKIEGTTNVEDTYIEIGNVNANFGGQVYFIIKSNIPALIRVKNVASELGAGATISACVCSVYCSSYNSEGDISAYTVFKPWNEGTLSGTDPPDAAEGEGVATWNDWSNDDEEWTTEGCLCARDGGVDNSYDGGVCNQDVRADRKATAESTDPLDAVDWYALTVSTTIAQGWYDGTKNEEGILLEHPGASSNYFPATEHTELQPFWVFTYTTLPGFGYDDEGNLTTPIEDVLWANRSSPASSGVLEGIKAWLTVTTEAHLVKLAVYKWSDTSFVDSTYEIDVPTGEGWVYFQFVNNASITASTEYALVVVAEATAGDCKIDFYTTGGSHAGETGSSYGVWPTPKWTTVNQSGSYQFSIYCFYTAEEEAAGQVIIINQ